MRYLMSLAVVLSLAALPTLVGCDDTLSHEKEVDVKDNGTVVKEESTVKETPSGDIVKEETKSVDKPVDTD